MSAQVINTTTPATQPTSSATVPMRNNQTTTAGVDKVKLSAKAQRLSKHNSILKAQVSVFENLSTNMKDTSDDAVFNENDDSYLEVTGIAYDPEVDALESRMEEMEEELIDAIATADNTLALEVENDMLREKIAQIEKNGGPSGDWDAEVEQLLEAENSQLRDRIDELTNQLANQMDEDDSQVDVLFSHLEGKKISHLEAVNIELTAKSNAFRFKATQALAYAKWQSCQSFGPDHYWYAAERELGL